MVLFSIRKHLLKLAFRAGYTELFKTGLCLCALLFGTAITQVAYADQDVIEEVIVTGSHIKGTPEDAELPVDVIDRSDLNDIGNPTMIDLVRNLGVTSANLGETNQFTTGGQANEGVTTVNLRGLGASRTLVLLNGRRHVSTQLNGADLSALPVSAVGRMEILKDGAAALYGSDAIGGVVNILTREGFEGFEIGGDFKSIEKSDGDWSVNGIFGSAGDRWNFMVAAEYGVRGELPARARNWALVNGDQNNPGGWSGIGNPANIQYRYPTLKDKTINLKLTQDGKESTYSNVPLAQDTYTTTVPDPQCKLLGSERYPKGSPGTCGFQYIQFDNLTEKQTDQKLYTEFNYEISENHNLHLELLYAERKLPEWKTSPSYPPQSLFGKDRIIPSNHPGLIDFEKQYKDAVAIKASGLDAIFKKSLEAKLGKTLASDAKVELQNGSGMSTNEFARTLLGDPSVYAINRAFGVGGAFNTGKAEANKRTTKTNRIALGLDGSVFDGQLDYKLSVAWSKRDRFVGGQDMYVERMGLALQGYGGPNCTLPGVSKKDGKYVLDGSGGKPGEGDCHYYNPFSRALSVSAINGAKNPDYNEKVANDPDMLKWLIGERGWNVEDELTSVQGIISGDTPWELSGGMIGFAAGFQVRNEKYSSSFWPISDRTKNPCPWTLKQSVALGLVDEEQLSPNCSSKTGVAAFLAASDPQRAERSIYSAFGEMALPISDVINVQAALRYEDYGANVGSSVDPKLAISWEVADAWTLRGSASTTFRGPPQSILGGTGTALSYVGKTAAFKAIDTVGNPNLKPETAVSMNLGLIYQKDNVYASVDYWSFTFEDSFQTESFNSIVNAYYTTYECVKDDKAVDNPTCNALRGHIFPVAAHTKGSRIERIEINWLNGQKIETSGVDISARYDFDNVMQGLVTVGLDGSYVRKYERGDLLDINGIKLADGGDLVGKLNYNLGPSFTSKPQIKINTYVKYETDFHNASLIARYVDSYKDEGAPANLAHLKTIDSHLTWDLHYNFTGWDKATLSLSVVNIADQDPPQARGDLNYDPFTHNPYGRILKLGFKYTVR